MKYITLMADYTQSCIKDSYDGPIDLNDLSLPCNIVTQLNRWNDQYKSIMPLSKEERAKRMDITNALDKEGLELSEKLRILLDACVRYFSEGLLKYIE